MNKSDLLRIIDAIHRDKNIEKAIVVEGIEQAILTAARKHFGEESEIDVSIDDETGETTVIVDGSQLNSDEIGDLLGRSAAQTAKQVMIQKIREAERDSLHEEYTELKGHIVTGSISQFSGGTATVNLGKVEGILPRSEQIVGESHRVGDRIRAIVLEVRKAGSRVRIILSRSHPEFVRRLFEAEIPEVADGDIQVRSLAREAGYRSKVAVSCQDPKIDCVGACVGVRGSRIKTIVDELAGERIDIVRWNDSLNVLVPNALQPAEVEDVILCAMLGKVIVLVREDQLSLAIGKKGQNVRLGSKLVGWDIHVLTQEKLDVQLDHSLNDFSQVPGIDDDLAENLVAQGFFTFDDLSVIEPEHLMELGNLSQETCDKIVAYADIESEKLEEEERMGLRKPFDSPDEVEAAKAKRASALLEKGEEVVQEQQTEETQPDAEAATDSVDDSAEKKDSEPEFVVEASSEKEESVEEKSDPEEPEQESAETQESVETTATPKATDPQPEAETTSNAEVITKSVEESVEPTEKGKEEKNDGVEEVALLETVSTEEKQSLTVEDETIEE